MQDAYNFDTVTFLDVEDQIRKSPQRPLSQVRNVKLMTKALRTGTRLFGDAL